jgi:PncC family amidohydrolase
MEQSLSVIKEFCLRRQQSIAVAESVTAGCLQTMLSTEKDAEKFFHGGITVYNTAQKTRHLNIEPLFAMTCNAVDLSISIKMAKEVCTMFCSSIGIGTTGYAAPFPEQNIKDPFAYIAIIWNEELLFAEKIMAKSSNYGLATQREYAETALDILAREISGIL